MHRSRNKKKKKTRICFAQSHTENERVHGRERIKKKADSQSISGRCKEDFGSDALRDAIVNAGDYRSYGESEFFREYPTERIEKIHGLRELSLSLSTRELTIKMSANANDIRVPFMVIMSINQ